MKIAMIVGTRPEFIKVAPVYRVFKNDPAWETTLISTGQHDTMLTQLADFFEISPDINLRVMKENQSLSKLTAILIEKLTELFSSLQPDFVLVQGDTTTTFAASLAAFYQQIKILHLEAGLRTHQKYAPFPEEINRKLTSVITDIHFCPTDSAKINLQKENVNAEVHIIGNTVIDSLLWAKNKISDNESSYKHLYLDILDKHQHLILVTAHRRENFGKGILSIAGAIKYLASQYRDAGFVYPVHLNPNIYHTIHRELSGLPNVYLFDPLEYDKMVYLMMKAFLVLTDSGGIQEEAPSLNLPAIVLRETTERKEALDANTSVLAGTEKEKIIAVFNDLYNNPTAYEDMAKSQNPFGDGKSAIRLKHILDTFIS